MMGVNYWCQVWCLEVCRSSTYPMYVYYLETNPQNVNEVIWKAIGRSLRYNHGINFSLLLGLAEQRRFHSTRSSWKCVYQDARCIQQTQPAFMLMSSHQAVLYPSEWKRESEAKDRGSARQQVLLWESKWRRRCHQDRFGRSARTKAEQRRRAAGLPSRRWQTTRWKRLCTSPDFIHLHAFRCRTDQRNYCRLELTTTSLGSHLSAEELSSLWSKLACKRLRLILNPLIIYKIPFSSLALIVWWGAEKKKSIVKSTLFY